MSPSLQTNEPDQRNRASPMAVRGRVVRSGLLTLPVAGLPPGVGDIGAGECGLLLIQAETGLNGGGSVDEPVDGSAMLGFHDRVLAATLRRSLSRGFPRSTALWLGAHRQEPLAVGPSLRSAVKAGRLIPLQWSPDAASQIEARGAERVFKELGICGLRRREGLVIEACAPWLTVARNADELVQRAAAVVAVCARLHRGPILCVAPSHYHGVALAELFARLELSELPAQGFERIALLRAQDVLHPVIEVLLWPALQGPAVELRAFGLVPRQSGGRFKVGWQADGSALALDAQVLLQANDAHRVYTLAEVANSRFGPPPGWEVLPDREAIEAACRHAVAATVILPYGGVGDYAPLAHLVSRLRREHPRALKIIVRELGDRLRHGQESVLLRLGANQVVYREVSLSRLEQAVQELRERLYGRPPVADPQALIDAIAPEPARGYRPPQAFCAIARRMLARGLDAKLGHSLLSLRLRSSIAHLDALAAFSFERDGDLVTAGENALHVFLYGCQQADAQGTLARLLSLPVGDLAAEVTLVTASIDINMALEAIAAQAHVSPPTDWTVLLRERQRHLREAQAATVAAPVTELPAAVPAALSAPDTRTLQPGTRVLVPHVLPMRTANH